MPIVTQAATVRENFLALVNNILLDVGERSVSSLVAPADHVTALMSQLNLTVEDIYSRADWSFKQEDWTFGPEDGVDKRALPSDFERIASGPRDPNRALRYRPAEEMDLLYPIQDTAEVDGTPLLWTLWQDGETLQQIHLYPPPDSDYCDDKVVKVTGVTTRYFVAKQTFTSATAVDKPITGSDWEDYWAEDTGISSATEYADATDYKAGRIMLKYYRRPQAMAADAHFPDIPNRFFDALKTGARARYKQFRQHNDWKDETKLYEVKLTRLVRRKEQVKTGHRVRFMR